MEAAAVLGAFPPSVILRLDGVGERKPALAGARPTLTSVRPPKLPNVDLAPCSLLPPGTGVEEGSGSTAGSMGMGTIFTRALPPRTSLWPREVGDAALVTGAPPSQSAASRVVARLARSLGLTRPAVFDAVYASAGGRSEDPMPIPAPLPAILAKLALSMASARGEARPAPTASGGMARALPFMRARAAAPRGLSFRCALLTIRLMVRSDWMDAGGGLIVEKGNVERRMETLTRRALSIICLTASAVADGAEKQMRRTRLDRDAETRAFSLQDAGSAADTIGTALRGKKSTRKSSSLNFPRRASSTPCREE
mmetsp:Transcript_7965/g.26203  ORF Transcript_7965/g.26203 Transcript_7965/m.26203 type:complete len:311 (-) Transcript_7965:534-1466(-)